MPIRGLPVGPNGHRIEAMVTYRGSDQQIYTRQVYAESHVDLLKLVIKLDSIIIPEATVVPSNVLPEVRPTTFARLQEGFTALKPKA